ncbi:sigma-70 RNA polymerase sigma factor region 4 domain-containing protein [Propionibacterium australiense]|uniref:Winged helix-turn-helix DNA-binding domain n=1 Tax=Propionibacterium australiense TaxID=119981 RepID=A0A383S5N9_9ACTN|nr:sigma-70 family RNA polymerase sigma factor [Propionibacterium australiense]SYZ33298.1 Winged helix-turn-helix DNA-binding domain [Propionibacterium australiense]VEH89208.1 RNA polymerase sigma-70 factor, sigma-E family [Propionibacterium australiense]
MGVPEGYREFVAEHTPALFRIAFLLSHDREAAENLLNRTARSLLKQYKHRASDAECAEWATLCVYRLFLEDAGKDGFEDAPPANAGEQSGEAFIARRLAALAPLDRAIAVHAVLDDCSSQKVATDLGCTTAEVRSALATFSALSSTPPVQDDEGDIPTVVMPAAGNDAGPHEREQGLIPLKTQPRKRKLGSIVEIRRHLDAKARRKSAAEAAAENSSVGSAAQIGFTWVQGEEPGSRGRVYSGDPALAVPDRRVGDRPADNDDDASTRSGGPARVMQNAPDDDRPQGSSPRRLATG